MGVDSRNGGDNGISVSRTEAGDHVEVSVTRTEAGDRVMVGVDSRNGGNNGFLYNQD